VANLYDVGYTSDYVRWLEGPNNLAVSTFTSKHRPWHLKAVFSCGHIEAEAIRLERFIKSQKSRKLIERMVKGEMLTGIWLSWLESRTCGINQRVAGSSPAEGAKPATKVVGFLFKVYFE